VPVRELADQLRLVEAVAVTIGREVRQTIEGKPRLLTFPDLSLDRFDGSPGGGLRRGHAARAQRPYRHAEPIGQLQLVGLGALAEIDHPHTVPSRSLVTINAIAQGETRFGTTQGGTPTSLTFSRISQIQGSIKRAGSPVGNLTGGSVTYSNNLEKIETIRDDGLIEGADPTIAALTGRIDVRFADMTLIDLAADGTPGDLEFANPPGASW
jgi:hypothetical protein